MGTFKSLDKLEALRCYMKWVKVVMLLSKGDSWLSGRGCPSPQNVSTVLDILQMINKGELNE